MITPSRWQAFISAARKQRERERDEQRARELLEQVKADLKFREDLIVRRRLLEAHKSGDFDTRKPKECE